MPLGGLLTGILAPVLASSIGGAINSANAPKPVQGGIQDKAVSAGDAAIAQTKAADALQQQQALQAQFAAQGGIQNQSNVFNQQQVLADQLAAMSRGEGPNPALAQLNNTTGQNIAQQAALMAGQRGAGANAGLIARQAAQQGGALQQAAVGQGAALRAQQQLGAISALQQQQGMLGNTAGQQVAQQQQATQSALTGAQNNQNAIFGQISNQNNNAVGLAGQQNQMNMQQQAQNNDRLNGIISGAGAAATALAPKLMASTPGASPVAASQPSSALGVYSAPAGGNIFGTQTQFAQGGQVGSEAILKENYGGRSKIGRHLSQFAKGGKVHNMQSGGKVAGTPKVAGAVDSYTNDVVSAKLSPGEIVLPRSVTMSKDPAAAAARFVAALKSRKG